MSIPNDLKRSHYKTATARPRPSFILLPMIMLAVCFGILSQTVIVNASPNFAAGPAGLAAIGSPGGNCDCSHDRYNCTDFASQEDAQACYWACGTEGKGDIHRLDLNEDLVACNSPLVNSNCNCDGDFYGCMDFESQEAAQACYWACGARRHKN